MSRVPVTATRRPRRLGAVFGKQPLGLLFVLVGLVAALLRIADGPEADLAGFQHMDRVTVAPGQTLWDIAVAHAPPGTDPRAYLQRVRDVNALDRRPVPAWTVVFIPRPHPPPRSDYGASTGSPSWSQDR